ncbi:hypothetical protein I4U23_019798 [Adineta vaga]|nr:hypothetical protein I4U23_019798 [Adineta vaga]
MADTSSVTSQAEQTTENIIIRIQQITSTTKYANTNRNKILISLFITLILISLFIGVSYCIFVYFTYYLHAKLPNDQEAIDLKRSSFISLESNAETQLYTCKTKSSLTSKRKESKHSLNNSPELFRYS